MSNTRHRRDHQPRQGHRQPDQVLHEAAINLLCGRETHARRLLDSLISDGSAATTVTRAIDHSLADLGAQGWDRPLLAHLVRRKSGTRAAEWIEGNGRDLWAGVQAVSALFHVPPLERLHRSTAPTNDGVDAKVLAKVRALLAKAEATNFPEEAQAYTAKAQELITRHALDTALLDGSAADVPSGAHIPIEDPYAGAKSLLLARVARANRCRAVYYSEVAISTVIGFEADLATVELLFTSLLVQATKAMVAEGERSGWHARQRAFRRSFLISFAVRIGERLAEASTAAESEVDAERSGALLPVLAKRSERVEEEFQRLFPQTTKTSTSISDGLGWQAGRVAADLADLAAAPQVRPAP